MPQIDWTLMTHLTSLNQPMISGIISASRNSIVFHQRSVALLRLTTRCRYREITWPQTGSDYNDISLHRHDNRSTTKIVF